MKRFYAAVPYPRFAKVLDGYLETAPEIEITPKTKLVLFSDWHISDGSDADDFKQNILLASHQVLPYYGGKNRWECVCLGDMLELVESTWKKIYAYGRNHVVLWQLNDLCVGTDNAGDDIPGNHDKKKHKIKHILFRGIKFPPAIKLVRDGKTIGLLIHGYQADIWNEGGLKTDVVNWFVKHVWTIAQKFGANSEPSWSPAKNKDKAEGLEKSYVRYVKEFITITINKSGECGRTESIHRTDSNPDPFILYVGHTHVPKMLFFGNNRGYINVGSGTKDGIIDAIEIEGGEIRSVYWDEDGRHVSLITGSA